MCVLCLDDVNIVVMGKLQFYARLDNRIIELYLLNVESPFVRVNTDDFRTILSQKVMNVENLTEAASDDD